MLNACASEMKIGTKPFLDASARRLRDAIQKLPDAQLAGEITLFLFPALSNRKHSRSKVTNTFLASMRAAQPVRQHIV